jgi:hypothetical protein
MIGFDRTGIELRFDFPRQNPFPPFHFPSYLLSPFFVLQYHGQSVDFANSRWTHKTLKV